MRGIPNGRIELTRPLDNENVMIDSIYPQLICVEATVAQKVSVALSALSEIFLSMGRWRTLASRGHRVSQ